ncbi:hypothetical protein [Actinosynnema pretiosum]|uniref:Uncharacterized protein n=1 Tax=Actinosynnema pretiosum TaxID=42197 RepID=A0A290Z5J8_9PSEU|nr:hypothetical protein [Actinosynnema pretiosum]ATE54297.1 hypothetical protein CNX65_14175 [Actinosynnema pretiosum]
MHSIGLPSAHLVRLAGGQCGSSFSGQPTDVHSAEPGGATSFSALLVIGSENALTQLTAYRGASLSSRAKNSPRQWFGVADRGFAVAQGRFR